MIFFCQSPDAFSFIVFFNPQGFGYGPMTLSFASTHLGYEQCYNCECQRSKVLGQITYVLLRSTLRGVDSRTRASFWTHSVNDGFLVATWRVVVISVKLSMTLEEMSMKAMRWWLLRTGMICANQKGQLVWSNLIVTELETSGKPESEAYAEEAGAALGKTWEPHGSPTRRGILCI